MEYLTPSLDPTDPLGTDLALDSNGDLMLTPQGDVETVSDLNNIKQMVRVRLQTIPDSYIFGTDLGSQLGETVDEPMSDDTIKLIQQYVVKALEVDPRITSIDDVTVTQMTDIEGYYIAVSLEVDGTDLQITVPIGGASGV